MEPDQYVLMSAPPVCRGFSVVSGNGFSNDHGRDCMADKPRFDSYTETYRGVINVSVKLSGEQYEHFAGLRLELMQKELAVRTGRRDGFSILDFGCGIGETAKIMRARFPASSITGVDESGESIAQAVALGLPNTTFIMSEENGIPLAAERFDVVYSNGTFHHIDGERQADFLAELQRTATDAGYIFIFENNPRNPLTVHAMSINPFDAGLKAVYPSRLISLGARVGLHHVKTSYYFFFPRILKIMRPLERFMGRVPFGAQYFVLFKKT
jgi:SAM-dependent methyltransferase